MNSPANHDEKPCKIPMRKPNLANMWIVTCLLMCKCLSQQYQTYGAVSQLSQEVCFINVMLLSSSVDSVLFSSVGFSLLPHWYKHKIRCPSCIFISVGMSETSKLEVFINVLYNVLEIGPGFLGHCYFQIYFFYIA